MTDPINPSHYKTHPSGLECIDLAEHFGFNLGNAMKYLWRAGQKGDLAEDLRKARWYVQRARKDRRLMMNGLREAQAAIAHLDLAPFQGTGTHAGRALAWLLMAARETQYAAGHMAACEADLDAAIADALDRRSDETVSPAPDR